MLNWWILLLFSRTLNLSSLFLLWKSTKPNLFTVIMVTLEGINTLRSRHLSQRNCNQEYVSVFSQEISSIKWWDNGTYFIWRYFCNKKDVSLFIHGVWFWKKCECEWQKKFKALKIVVTVMSKQKKFWDISCKYCRTLFLLW